MGKGSARRKCQVSDAEMAERWAQAFRKPIRICGTCLMIMSGEHRGKTLMQLARERKADK